MTHFWTRRHFSAYLDGDLDERMAGKVRDHLSSCVSCQAAFKKISEGARFASQFEQSAPPDAAQLWAKIAQRRDQESQIRWAGSSGKLIAGMAQWVGSLVPTFRRPAMIGAFAFLLIANLVVSYKILNPPQTYLADRVSRNDLDYGLYLDAMSRDADPKEFDNLYQSEPVEYEAASAAIHFELASYTRLAKDYQVFDAKLLKTSCCYSVPCNISSGAGEIVLFQQAQDHPFSFGVYRLERTLIDGHWFHVTQAGKYQVASWVTQTSKIVFVGEQLFDELPNLIRLIGQS